MVGYGEIKTICGETGQAVCCSGLAYGRKQFGKYEHNSYWMLVRSDWLKKIDEELITFPRSHNSEQPRDGEAFIVVYRDWTSIEEGLSIEKGDQWGWRGIQYLSIETARKTFPRSVKKLVDAVNGNGERPPKFEDSTELWS